MKVVAVAGVKGGVGKTSAAVNLAHLASLDNLRTLLWDLDPQGAATHCYRPSAAVIADSSVADAGGRSGGPDAGGGGGRRGRRGRRRIQRGVHPHIRSISPTLDLLPADPERGPLAVLSDQKGPPVKLLRTMVDRLADGGGSGRDGYDVVILDCAPGTGPMTEAVLAVSDLVLTPVVPTPLSLRTLGQFEQFVLAKRPGLPMIAFLSMADERKVLHRQLLTQIGDDPRFSSAVVPVSSSVERMGLEQRPAVEASPRNLAARAYGQLWREVSLRLGV